MANPEHVAKLKSSIDEWNAWRINEGADTYFDFSGADLSGANLSGSLLNMANFTRANLNGADLFGANLRGANLSATNLKGVDLGEVWLGWTIFANTNLTGAKGLETCGHQGPSSIGIDTFFRSNGQIPEIFLRGCGVPEQFITYAPSLITEAIEFYSCFISYSSQDQAFAERLHADLRAKNLRCRFAPEDLKIGDRFQERIEDSIRLFDKVLGGHPKSGQWWSPQNRPIESSQNKVVIARSDVSRQVLFWGMLLFRAGLWQTDATWAEDTATLGSDRSAGSGADRAGWPTPPGFLHLLAGRR